MSHQKSSPMHRWILNSPMNCLFDDRFAWSILSMVLIFFSCGKDELPTKADTPPLFFTIATSANIGGSITSHQRVENGKTVSITATAQDHYRFKEWTGDCPISGTEATVRFEATQHCSITAVFEKMSYAITTTATPGGAVRGLSSQGPLPQGQAVVLQAVAKENHVFSQWQITPTTNHKCPSIPNPKIPVLRFVVQGPCAFQAVFQKASRTITTAINTGGTISPTQTVEHDQPVTITVTLEEGYTLNQWTDNCGTFSPQDLTITFPATEDCQLQAILEKKQYLVQATATLGGSVNNPNRIEAIHGQQVEFTAQADENHVFAGWKTQETSECPTLENPKAPRLSFTVKGSCQVQALFMKAPRTITTSVSQEDGGRITPTTTVDHGQEVQITLTLEEGYTLNQWTGNCGTFSPQETTIKVSATKDCQVTAVLQEVEEEPTPQTQDCNGQQIPINEDCPAPQPQTQDCNGQQIPINEDCPADNTPEITTMPVNPIPSNSTAMDPVNDCVNPLEVAHNGITIRVKTACESQKSDLIGQIFSFNGESYTIVDDELIRERRNQGGSMHNVVTTFVENMTVLFFNNHGCDEHQMNCQFINSTFNDDISTWDVSNVKSMAFMFSGARSFNQNIGAWDVRQVTNMQAMFDGARMFNQSIDQWKVGQVNRCFRAVCNLRAEQRPNFSNCNTGCLPIQTTIPPINVCHGLTTAGDTPCPDDLLIKHVNGVTVIINPELQDPRKYVGQKATVDGTEYTIVDEKSLRQRVNSSHPAVENIVTTLVTDMSSLFLNKTNFNQDISTWDVSNVTNMNSMFSRASAFNQPIGDWDVSRVMDMFRMFFRASTFNQPIGDWDVSRVTDMHSLFGNAIAFNQDIGDWNVSNVKTMEFMFGDAIAFNQDIGDWDVSRVTNMHTMFYKASVFNQDIGDWNVSNVTNMQTMFFKAFEFNQDIGDWNVSSVTNMSHMFGEASAFNQDIGDWDVSSVTSMWGMFLAASAFNQNIGDWNVSSVINMRHMFEVASLFNENISGWNVSSVTDMEYMFYNATTFNQDLSGWNTSNVTNCSRFAYNSALTTAHRPSFSNCTP